MTYSEVTYRPPAGVDIGEAARKAIDISVKLGREIVLIFNGHRIDVCPGHSSQVIAAYQKVAYPE